MDNQIDFGTSSALCLEGKVYGKKLKMRGFFLKAVIYADQKKLLMNYHAKGDRLVMKICSESVIVQKNGKILGTDYKLPTVLLHMRSLAGAVLACSSLRRKREESTESCAEL